jgi:cysteine desulfurase
MPQISAPAYLDHAATTPLDPAVLEAMLPYLRGQFGNASSRNHRYGWAAAAAVDKAREQVAGLLGVQAQEIVFTSGATESLNLAIKGVWERYQSKGRHIVTCATEHRAVLDTCRHLERKGAELTVLDVDAQGHLDLAELERAITERTVLVALMFGNNETGVLHPIEAIAALVRNKGSLLCCDATQAVGKMALNPCPADLLAISAHKFGGPKGCGALYVRRRQPRVSLEPLLDGGGHERGLRSGTLNVPGIAGMGAAAELALERLPRAASELGELRERLENLLISRAGARINGDAQRRLPHISNLCFSGLKAESLLASVSDVLAASTASACSSASLEPSHVLTAMGLSRSGADASLRLSVGWGLEPEDALRAAQVLADRAAEAPASGTAADSA